jgi:GntR family transcriptional regulator/MocR family aminotransferase
VVDILDLDRARPCSLTDQIFIAIRDGIASGRLSPGTRLPASRELARSVGVARNTILNAYDELRRQGVVVARRGSGTVIAPVGAVRRAPPVTGRPRRSSRADDVARASTTPKRPWMRAMQSSLTGLSRSVDLHAVREAFAEFLAIRGVRCTAENIFLTTNPRQAIDICFRTVAATEQHVFLEDPGTRLVQAVALVNGLTPAFLPVDALGANIAAALREVPAARAAYVTPAHQNPLGVVMSEERRQALVAWAVPANSWIIEDDGPATLRRQQAMSMYVRDGRVLHTGTLAHTMEPLTSLSFVVTPDSLVDRFAEVASLTGTEAAVAEQLAARQLILSRSYQRSVEKARDAAERRAAIVARACDDHLLWFVARAMGTETGERVVLWLQRGFDVVAITDLLRSHGVHADRLRQFSLSPVRDALVLRLEAVRTERLVELIRRIASAVRDSHGDAVAPPAEVPEGCLYEAEAPSRFAAVRS